MPDKPNPYNSHQSAAGAYDKHAQTHTPDQRELEARVLLKAARFMKDLQGNWEGSSQDVILETLKYNRQIWMMFYDTAIENKDGGEEGRPDDLRSNIINLANFIFKRETEILSDPSKDKFDILIDINHDIAAGLMSSAENDKAASQGDNSPNAAEPSSVPPSGGGSTDISS